MSFSTFLTIISTSLVFLYFLIKWTFSKNPTPKNLPPSPPRLPIIGNLLQLKSSAPQPHIALRNLSRKYKAKDLLLLKVGTRTTVVASSIAAAKEILRTHDTNFSNRPQGLAGKKLLYNSRDIVSLQYGEHWRQMKSVAVVHCLSTKNVRSFGQVREQETAVMVDTIRKSINSQVNLSDLFASLASNVLCRAALGKRHSNSKELATLLAEQSELLRATVGDYLPWLSWINRVDGTITRMEKVANGLDTCFEQFIADHDKKLVENEQDDTKINFLDIILKGQRENTLGFQMDRTSVKCLILDMITPGIGTTYTALDWAMADLLRHPNVMKRLQEEVRAVGKGKTVITNDDLQDLPYLKAVIKESFRLHPALPVLVPREAIGDVKVLGYDVAAGSRVFINMWAIGRDPTIWGDGAEEFRPERFLDSPIDYKGQHFELMTFGGGRRSCPGMGFATAMDEIGLANAVRLFDWSLPSGSNGVDMTETIGFACQRKYPLIAIPKLASF